MIPYMYFALLLPTIEKRKVNSTMAEKDSSALFQPSDRAPSMYSKNSVLHTKYSAPTKMIIDSHGLEPVE